MKKLFLFPLAAVLAIVFFVACNKNDTPTCTPFTVEQDRHVIDSFINANEFNSISYNSTNGVYSGILLPGSGSAPVGDSLVTFDVVTRLLNGVVIDSTRNPNATSAITIKLSDLNNANYAAVYEALSALKEGGLYRYIALSRTQAGCLGTNIGGKVVPPNAQIIYDYRLVDVSRAQ